MAENDLTSKNLITSTPDYSQYLSPVSAGVLKELEAKLKEWERLSKLLQKSLIGVGVLAITCSLLITTFAGSPSFSVSLIRILAFATTLLLTLITSFNLTSKASSTRSAWRLLNKAMFSYKSKRIDGDALIKAYEEGENLLSSVDFNSKMMKS